MEDPYIYPELDEEGNEVLANKLGIKSYKELRQAGGDLSFVKLLTFSKEVDQGEFDLQYLKDIHKYLLGDLFEWAGELRTIPMEKSEKVLGGDTIRYTVPQLIQKEIIKKLKAMNDRPYEKMNIEEKGKSLTRDFAGIWQVHPFRDGNTRSILAYSMQFAQKRGFPLKSEILLQHFTYVRNALVKASDGPYAEYQYLEKILIDAIKQGNQKEEDKELRE